MTVLTPNPAVDLTYRVAEQRIGTTQRVLDVARRPGGKGVNVARVLQSVGARARCVLPLGGASGAWLAENLDVPATVVPLAGQTRSTVTVVDGEQHPTMFGEPGPAVTGDEWAAVTEVAREVAREVTAPPSSWPVPCPRDRPGPRRRLGPRGRGSPSPT